MRANLSRTAKSLCTVAATSDTVLPRGRVNGAVRSGFLPGALVYTRILPSRAYSAARSSSRLCPPKADTASRGQRSPYSSSTIAQVSSLSGSSYFVPSSIAGRSTTPMGRSSGSVAVPGATGDTFHSANVAQANSTASSASASLRSTTRSRASALRTICCSHDSM